MVRSGRWLALFAASSLVYLSFSPALLSSAPGTAHHYLSQPAPAGSQVLAIGAFERALFEAINRERAARGIPTLKLSPALSDLARRHSEEMARRRQLTHESAAGGTLKERLDRARIANALNAENVARGDASDPAVIHDALMKSDGHRANILLPNVDEVGIGVVSGPGGSIYVTEDFVRSVTWLDEAAVRQAVIGVLHEVRRKKGQEPIVVSDEISRTARAFALRKAEGRRLPALPREFGEVRVDFYTGVELDGIAARIREQPLDRFRMAGIGVHIGPAPGYPSGAYQVCTFLLTADPILLRDEPARVRTVLQTVNTVRAERALEPFVQDAALNAKANDFDRRYREDRALPGRGGSIRRSSRLFSDPERWTVVIYETSDLGKLAAGLRSRIAEPDAWKIGISVKPAQAGLTVDFVVVLVF